MPSPLSFAHLIYRQLSNTQYKKLDIIVKRLSNAHDLGHIHALLRRIHGLMERYFDAIENSLASKDYRFEQRDRDARVFGALARTLEKLTKLESLIIAPAQKQNLDDRTIHAHLEQRLARLVDAQTETDISQKP